MEIREPTENDSDRIRELVESSMTTSFALSPQEIESISQEWFDEKRLRHAMDQSETVIRVAETDEDVEEQLTVGFVEGVLSEPWGEVTWLFVDPEHRGNGIGTQLYETVSEILRDRGAQHIRILVLEANTEGEQFAKRLGLERIDERHVEMGDKSLVTYSYADSSEDTSRRSRPEAGHRSKRTNQRD